MHRNNEKTCNHGSLDAVSKLWPIIFWDEKIKSCTQVHMEVFIYKLLFPTLQITVLQTKNYKKCSKFCCPCTSM
jgi:hypothetical protein